MVFVLINYICRDFKRLVNLKDTDANPHVIILCLISKNVIIFDILNFDVSSLMHLSSKRHLILTPSTQGLKRGTFVRFLTRCPCALDQAAGLHSTKL